MSRQSKSIAFAAAAGFVGYLALDGGGYDIIVRQTVAMVVWGLVAVGFAFGVLPRSSPGRLALVPLCAGAGLAIWMLLSFAWTASDERTTAELARFLGYAGIAVLALSGLNRHTFRAAAAGISVAALAIAALAVASRLFPDFFTGADDVGVLLGTDRLSFPLDSWNAVGAWGAMACAIGIAWSAHANNLRTRTLALAVVPVAGLAVYLSYSRAGVIGTAVAVGAVLVLSRARRRVLIQVVAAAIGTAVAILAVRANQEIAEATGGEGTWLVVLALIAAAAICASAVRVSSSTKIRMAQVTSTRARLARTVGVVVLVVAVLAAVFGPIADWSSEFGGQDTPVAGEDPAARLIAGGGNRNDIWTSALDAVADQPILGIGPGTFEFWWLREAGDPEYVRDAHSLYLEHAAELGLPGLVLFLVALAGLGVLALAARPGLDDPDDIAASVALTSAFAVFCVNAGVDWLWEVTAVGGLAIASISVAAAAGSPRRSRARRQARLHRPGARAAVVAVAVLAALVQVPGIVSTDRIRASDEALRAGDLEAAGELARQSIDAEPWAARPHAQLALVEREAGRPDLAEQEIRIAIEREPDNWEWPLVLALVLADAGDRESAIRTFTDGRELAPHLAYYSPFFLYGQQIFTERQLERMIDQARAGEPVP